MRVGTFTFEVSACLSDYVDHDYYTRLEVSSEQLCSMMSRHQDFVLVKWFETATARRAPVETPSMHADGASLDDVSAHVRGDATDWRACRYCVVFEKLLKGCPRKEEQANPP
jgi:hypothetical protein